MTPSVGGDVEESSCDDCFVEGRYPREEEDGGRRGPRLALLDMMLPSLTLFLVMDRDEDGRGRPPPPRGAGARRSGDCGMRMTSGGRDAAAAFDDDDAREEVS